jgi:hypothetical protein
VTDPTTEPELEPLQPRGSGLAAKVTALGVVVIASAIVVTGLLGGRSADGDVATATISPRPSRAAPASPEPSPELLPIHQLGATDAGLGRIVVWTGTGLGYVERSTGRIEPIDVDGNGYLLPAGADGWLCVCEVRPWGSETDRRVVRLVRIGNDGRLGEVVLERELTAARGSSMEPPALYVQAAVDADGATAALGWIGRREDGTWRLEVELVPLHSDGSEGSAVVADIPADPSTLEVGGLFVAFDPSGTALAIGPWLALISLGEASFSAPRWIVPITDGRPGPARPLVETAVVGEGGSDATCNEEGWVGAQLFGAVCLGQDGKLALRRWGADGGALDALDLGPTFQVDGLGVRLATPAGAVLAWDPFGHRLSSLDAIDGDVQVSPRGGGPPDYPGEGVPPSDRSILFGSESAFAVAPGGGRAYALGEATSPDGPTGPDGSVRVRSTGIWVLDLMTRRIVDNWPATARYMQVGVSPDGREVIAVGMAGLTADGRASPDQAFSLTVFDAETGDVRLVAGQLDGAGWLSLP